jgi:ribosome maturation factor RimP
MTTESDLIKLLEPEIEALGYELVALDVRTGGRGLLRLYIDGPDGVDVNDCERVSHQVSGLLDVEDPIPGEYTLEVSSPGLDRPLRKAEHFQRFEGQKAKVRLKLPRDGRRRFKGRISNAGQDDFVLESEEGNVRIALDEIDLARLVPDL